MSTVLINQPLRLTLETSTALTDATTVKILYKKPCGTEGEFSATVSGTTIYSNIVADALDTAGTWYFHSSVLFSGEAGATLGKIAKQYIYGEFET